MYKGLTLFLLLALCLLVTFANSLDPDQAPQTSGLNWIQNVETLMVFLKEISEKIEFEEKEKDTKKSCKIVQ